MRTIINGSRDITDYSLVETAMELSGIKPTEVISGGARGPDRLGERWAKEKGVKLTVMPADWDTHGKGAGYVRNAQMVDAADALVSIWDGQSKGTRHTISLVGQKGLRVFVLCVPGPTS